MTEPALGSGALREALENMLRLYEMPHDQAGQETPGQYYRAAKAALSLSSPIEPETGVLVTDGVPSFYPKVVNQAQASSEVREAVAQVIADHEFKCDDGIGRPACRCGWVSRDLGEGDRPFKYDPTLFHGDHLTDKIIAALAPSRQGAAKRVEG